MIFRQTEEFIYFPDEYVEFEKKQEELRSAGIRFTVNITTSVISIRCSTEWVSVPSKEV